METIKIGVHNMYPFLYVDEANNLAGIIAPLYFNLYYFIIDRVNVTFVLHPKNSSDFCADNGVCTGSLMLLQKNEIDFNHQVALNSVNHVGTNLTLTSVIMEERCYLSYNSKLQVSLTSSSFFDFFSSFQLAFWILTIFYLSIFIMLNSLLLRFEHHISLVKILWSQFDYILGQNYVSNFATQKKCFFLIFIIFQLLVNKILMASLRTGLVQHSEYLQLESFQDVLKYNFTVRVSYQTICAREFMQSVDPVVRKARIEHKVFSGMRTATQIYQALRIDGTVNNINDFNFQAAKNFGCYMNPTEEKREPLRKSEQPAFRTNFVYLMSKLASVKKMKIMMNGLYSAFETGCISSKIINKYNKKCYLKFDASPACTDYKYDTTEIKVTPISMAYLETSLIILIIGLMISVSTFIVQCNRFYIHRYFYNRSLSI